MLPRGTRTFAAITISLLATSAYAVQPAYAAGFGDLFTGLFEYTMDVDADELFPSKQAREDLISNNETRQFHIEKLEHKVAGFNVSARDLAMQLSPSQLDPSITRIDIALQGKSVEIDGSLLSKKYDRLDIGGIYCIYNADTNKMTIHMPYALALSLLFR